MTKKEELHLPELQKKDLKCVFCGKSNQKYDGGYFKRKFLCKECDVGIKTLNHFLERE